MDLSEIIGDAITYPLHNIKSLIIFMIIGIVGGLLSGMSIVGMLAAVTGQNAVVRIRAKRNETVNVQLPVSDANDMTTYFYSEKTDLELTL